MKNKVILLVMMIVLTGCQHFSDFFKPGQSSLQSAISKGNSRTVSRLLARGADLNTPLENNASKDYPIHLVASGHGLTKAQQLELLDLLVKSGADLNVRDIFGRTPLTIAAGGGGSSRYQAVNFLIEKGSEIDTVDQLGRTPLMYASMCGCKKSIAVLLSFSHESCNFSEDFVFNKVNRSANPNRIDWNDKTALIYALENAANKPNIDLSYISILISRGADINYKMISSGGVEISPTETARANGDKRLLQLLSDERNRKQNNAGQIVEGL